MQSLHKSKGGIFAPSEHKRKKGAGLFPSNCRVNKICGGAALFAVVRWCWCCLCVHIELFLPVSGRVLQFRRGGVFRLLSGGGVFLHGGGGKRANPKRRYKLHGGLTFSVHDFPVYLCDLYARMP